MFNSEIQYGRITFRYTTKTDLDDVMKMESGSSINTGNIKNEYTLESLEKI
ncbi:MAG: hypothetical protein ACYS67_07775 [Planctomycetota bacterium]|jgi:hypothetical protein